MGRTVRETDSIPPISLPNGSWRIRGRVTHLTRREEKEANFRPPVPGMCMNVVRFPSLGIPKEKVLEEQRRTERKAVIAIVSLSPLLWDEETDWVSINAPLVPTLKKDI